MKIRQTSSLGAQPFLRDRFITFVTLMRWNCTVNFNISTGISPNWDECKIFYVTSSKRNFLLLLKVPLFVLYLDDLDLLSFYTWMILWYWNFFKGSSKVIAVPRKFSVSFFKSNSAIIFIKKEFIKFLGSFSSLKMWPSSFNKSLFEFKPLLLNYDLIVFQSSKLLFIKSIFYI